MLGFLRYITSTNTFRQSSVTFSSIAVNGILGALFYIIVARSLGPYDFGLLAISLAILTLVADVADLGINSGIVRFVNKYIKESEEVALRFLKLALEIKVFVSIFIIILGWVLAPYLASLIFKKEELTWPLRLVFIGVFGMQLFSFSTTTFQAFQRFWSWSMLQISSNGIRLLIIMILLTFGLLNLQNTLLTFMVIPFFGFAVSLFILPRRIITVSDEKNVAGQLFHYSKWIAISTVITATSSRLDTLISARLLQTAEVGYYAAANQLVLVVPQIVAALGTVLAPKMASLITKKEIIEYLKKTQVFVLALAIIGLFTAPLIVFLIPVIYGNAYSNHVPQLFFILLVAMLVFLISVPIHGAINYYFAYPKLFTYLSLGHFVIAGVGGWVLISQYGTVGAALTVLAGALFNFLIPLIWVLRKLYEKKDLG